MSHDRTPFGGDEFADLEERLRVALTQEARDMEPHDRLDDIRAEVADGDASRGRRPWLAPLATAAAVAVIAAVAWLSLRPSTAPPVSGATTNTTTTSVAPSTSASTSPTPSATSTTSTPPTTTTATTPPPATGPQAVPVYFVGPYGKQKWGLVREFLPAPPATGSDRVSAATAALNLALDARPYAKTDGYLQPWPAGTKVKRVVAGSSEIQVVLSGPGVRGLTAEQQRVSVQQVVWTATAALQQNLPVRVSVPGDGPIFETMPSQAYQRPPATESYRDLAPIWIDSPSRDQVLPSSAPVVVKGQACTFEANVRWELKQGGVVLKQGFTTATSGCPTQGSYSVDLGVLPPGAYQFRAFEASASDGSLVAQKVVAFTVQ